MKIFEKLPMATLLGASFLLVPSDGATASDQGTFTAVMSFTADYTRIDFAGGTITGGPLRGPSTITKSSGGPFVEGESAVRTCVVFAKETSAGVDLQAPCTITDAAGDKLFMMATRNAGDVSAGGGGKGTQQILGGTGKYDGMTGSCDYMVNYLPENFGVTQANCRWQKP